MAATIIDVSQTTSCEITLVCLSVSVPNRPLLSFLKIGSLVFPDIVYD